MNIISQLAIVGLYLAIGGAKADEIKPVEGTLSPQGVSIVLVSTPTSDAYKFWDSKSKQFIGDVLPPEYTEGLRNVYLVADWNPSGTKLALLFYYGTKLNTIYLYSLDQGKVKAVQFDCPDPVEVYKSVHKHSYDLSESSGNDYNSLGPWVDDNTVMLIAGDSRDIHDKQSNKYLGTSTLLVSFKVQVVDSKATVSDQKLIGPLSGEDRDSFLKKWGDQYQ